MFIRKKYLKQALKQLTQKLGYSWYEYTIDGEIDIAKYNNIDGADFDKQPITNKEFSIRFNKHIDYVNEVNRELNVLVAHLGLEFQDGKRLIKKKGK